MTSVALAVKVRVPGTPRSVTSAIEAWQVTETVTVPPGSKLDVSTAVVRFVQGTPALARLAATAASASVVARSEEHTSELQSLMRTSSAVFRLNIKKHK